MNNTPPPAPGIPSPRPAPVPKAPVKVTDKVRINPFTTISDQEKIDFARHLAIIIKAGIPLYDGLIILKKQSRSQKVIAIIDALARSVSNGISLADSLDPFHNAFGDFFISVIQVGERSGTLGQNLLYLSEQIKKSRNLKRKIKSAMVYPTIVLVATLCVTAFLAFFVFPKLLPALLESGGKLPASTELLVTLINFFSAYGLIVIGELIAAIVIFQLLLRYVMPFRYVMHRLILATPVFSKLAVGLNMVNFARVFSLLLVSDVKITEALVVTSKTFDNVVYRRIILEASKEIGKGGTLAQFLEEHPKLFPPFITGMIQIGEATGNLNDNLSYVAEYYDEEVSYELDALTTIIEPVMLLFMGLMVGFVAISIITPIYSISANLSQ